MYKIFVVGLYESQPNISRDQIDNIASSLSELFGHKITRVILQDSFGEKGKTFYSSQYMKKCYVLQDIYKIEFLNMPAKCNWLYDINLSFCIKNRDNGVSSIRFSAMLPESYALDRLYEQLFEILVPVLEPRWLSADCIHKKAAVEFFTNGTLSSYLDETERRISSSINQSNLVHSKMPFLFSNNYISESMLQGVNCNSENAIQYENGVLLSYPFDYNTPFSDYPNDKAWLTAFRLLSEADVIHSKVQITTTD